MKPRLVVGTRGSSLAMVQTESVVARIRELNPGLEVNISRIVTAGDRDRQSELDKIGVAVFVKELEEALLDGRIDLAVHSLKDMPVDLPEGLGLAAVTERLDPRDALVTRASLMALPQGARIGTDSLRRAAQLFRLRPDISVSSIRGNVGTRLRKVASGEFDGVVVAAAAMLRLGWPNKITEYLPLEQFLPAVGQGVLGLEARLNDKEALKLVSPLNDAPTWQSVTAERAFLRTLGGGCRAPIAALGTVSGTVLKLEGMVASIDGEDLLRISEEGNVNDPETLGTHLAQRILGMGAGELIAEVRR